ncbi:MAG TPA: hypothetical protein PKE50_02465, partial [Rhodocyclaceae bacterium]|nr:hypothetical protein [Rhodocyclaceae bacterium]
MPQGFSRLEQGAGGKMGVSIYLERRCSYNRKVLFRPPQLSAGFISEWAFRPFFICSHEFARTAG